MRVDRRLWVPVAMLLVVLSGGTVYAFNALSVMTTLNVKEPLSITAAKPTGDLGLDSITCDISKDSLTATCAGSVFAGDIGGINVTVANAGHQALTVTPKAISSSNDVTMIAPTAATVPSAGSLKFAFDVTVSASSIDPQTVTLSITFAR